MKNIIFVMAVAIPLALSAPLHAQVSEDSPASEPIDQNQTPGLQQAPDGQTMKVTGDKEKSRKETQAAPVDAPTSSTGPTFPSDRPSK
jgi:hypothetical protein